MNRLYLLVLVLIFFVFPQSVMALALSDVPLPAEPVYNVKIHSLDTVPSSVSKQAVPVLKPPIEQKNINNIQQTNKTTDFVKDDKFEKKIKLSSVAEIREQARFLYNTNSLNESYSLFLSIPEKDRTSDDLLLMANISQDLEKTDDAVFYLKKAIDSDKNNYKAHYNLGNIYFSEKQYNAALKKYREVLRIKKDFAYAHYNKGCCYLAQNSLINARYEFGLAIKSNPEEPLFYYNLAYVNKLMKKEKKAQEALDLYNQLMTQ